MSVKLFEIYKKWFWSDLICLNYETSVTYVRVIDAGRIQYSLHRLNSNYMPLKYFTLSNCILVTLPMEHSLSNLRNLTTSLQPTLSLAIKYILVVFPIEIRKFGHQIKSKCKKLRKNISNQKGFKFRKLRQRIDICDQLSKKNIKTFNIFCQSVLYSCLLVSRHFLHNHFSIIKSTSYINIFWDVFQKNSVFVHHNNTTTINM